MARLLLWDKRTLRDRRSWEGRSPSRVELAMHSNGRHLTNHPEGHASFSESIYLWRFVTLSHLLSNDCRATPQVTCRANSSHLYFGASNTFQTVLGRSTRVQYLYGAFRHSFLHVPDFVRHSPSSFVALLSSVNGYFTRLFSLFRSLSSLPPNRTNSEHASTYRSNHPSRC